MAIATDPNDPNFGLETDISSPDFGLPVKQEAPEPSGFLKGLETAQKVVGAGQEALMALYRGPGATINRLMFPAQHEWENRPIIPTEVVQPIRKALQYPIQTLNQIVTGEEFKEPLPELGKFASEQISGQTSPENLALLAVAPAIGKLAGGIKLPTTLRETVFGEKPVAPEVTPQIPETPITDVVTQKQPIQEEVIPSAIKERQISESNIQEYPGDGEGGPPAETGGGGGIEPSPEIQGRQEVAPAVPSEALAEEGVPQPEQPVVPPEKATTPEPEVMSEIAPETGGVSAARLEERPINSPPPGEGVGWQESRAFGNEWLDKGGNINKVMADFNRTGKLDEWDVGKGAAYLERLQSVTNRAEDALRVNPNDPVLQQQYGSALRAEQRFTDAYRPMATAASNQLKGFQGKTPLTTEMADSFSGLKRKFGEIQGREMTPEEVVKTDRLAKQNLKAKTEYRAANDAFYRQADSEFGRIRTTRKGPPTLEDIGRIFGEKLKEVCDI